MVLVIWVYSWGRGVADQCLWLQVLHNTGTALPWRWRVQPTVSGGAAILVSDDGCFRDNGTVTEIIKDCCNL